MSIITVVAQGGLLVSYLLLPLATNSAHTFYTRLHFFFNFSYPALSSYVSTGYSRLTAVWDASTMEV